MEHRPFHLQAKWLEVTNSIQESGQCPRIYNISKFVSEKVQAAYNAVFGGALDSDKDKSERDRSGATHGNFSGPYSWAPKPSEKPESSVHLQAKTKREQ